jgi:hypothetical protein
MLHLTFHIPADDSNVALNPKICPDKIKFAKSFYLLGRKVL